MTEPVPVKKRGHLGALLITVAALLIIFPAYVAEYLTSRGRFSVSVIALLSLAMFLVGAFLLVWLLKD
jgi:hypothetical protein